MNEDGYAPEFLAVIGLVNENFPQPDWTRPDPLGSIEECIVYTRLSRQDDKSHSPETQRFACEQLAKGQGWKILKVVDRDALNPISGKSFEARPGWDEVKAFVGTLKWAERRKRLKSFGLSCAAVSNSISTRWQPRLAAFTKTSICEAMDPLNLPPLLARRQVATIRASG